MEIGMCGRVFSYGTDKDAEKIQAGTCVPTTDSHASPAKYSSLQNGATIWELNAQNMILG